MDSRLWLEVLPVPRACRKACRGTSDGPRLENLENAKWERRPGEEDDDEKTHNPPAGLPRCWQSGKIGRRGVRRDARLIGCPAERRDIMSTPLAERTESLADRAIRDAPPFQPVQRLIVIAPLVIPLLAVSIADAVRLLYGGPLSWGTRGKGRRTIPPMRSSTARGKEILAGFSRFIAVRS